MYAPIFLEHRRRGFSLTEMAIVIGIAGIIISGVWVLASQSWEHTRREQAVEAITAVVTGVRSLYAGQLGVPNAGYQTLSAQLISRNVIPPAMRRPDASCAVVPCADTPWAVASTNADGTFRVCNWSMGGVGSCGAAAPGSVSQFFGVVLTNLNMGACIMLVNQISSSLGPAGLMDVSVNGVLHSATPATASVTFANTNCAPDATVIFVYRVTVSPS